MSENARVASWVYKYKLFEEKAYIIIIFLQYLYIAPLTNGIDKIIGSNAQFLK